jgi:hypothetical protein
MSKKNTPTSKDVGANVLDELNTLVEKVTAWIGNPPALTGTEIRRSTKLRKGGETVIPTVAALANQFGLTSKAHPTDAMVAKMKMAQSLIPLHRKLVAATKQVGDTMFLANSESWASAAVHYATLSKMARSDGDVAKTLAPVTEFFAHRSPAVVQAEDAKRGGRKGSKAAKAAPAPVAATDAPGNGSPVAAAVAAPSNGGAGADAATATAPATPQAATPSPASVSATHS